jgi:uncharacterized protein YndB with AHSA1/START domain
MATVRLPTIVGRLRPNGNQEVASVEEHRRIARRIEIKAPASEVWEALVDAPTLSEWLGAEAELEPRDGGAARFTFPDGTRRLGIVESFEPPRRLGIRWREVSGAGPSLRIGEPSTVVFELVPTTTGTAVTVTESPGVLAPDPEALAHR